MPYGLIGWDVFCWLGHRRFARHWSVPQLRAELLDSYQIALSEDAIEDYLQLSWFSVIWKGAWFELVGWGWDCFLVRVDCTGVGQGGYGFLFSVVGVGRR
jgi:hypothetical protein